MSEPPSTIRGLLAAIWGGFTSIVSDIAAIRTALYVQTVTPPSVTTGVSVAALLHGALTAPTSEFSEEDRVWLSALFVQHVGGLGDTPARGYLDYLVSLNRLNGIASAVGWNQGNEFTQWLYQDVRSLRALLAQLSGYIQPSANPVIVRTQIDAILAAIQSLNTAAGASQVTAEEANVLLAGLLECCQEGGGDGPPVQPTLCEVGELSWAQSSGWSRVTPIGGGDLTPIAIWVGSGSIGDISWEATTAPAGVLGNVPAIRIWTDGALNFAANVCLSWEGSSGEWQSAALVPVSSAQLYQDTINLNAPAPATQGDTIQVYPSATSERSTFYLEARDPDTPAAPSPDAVCFLVARLIPA